MLNTHPTTHRAVPCETRTFRPKQSTLLRQRDIAIPYPPPLPAYGKDTPNPSPGLSPCRIWHNQVLLQMHPLKIRGFMKILQRVHKCLILMFLFITYYRHKAIQNMYLLLSFIYIFLISMYYSLNFKHPASHSQVLVEPSGVMGCCPI